MNTSLGVASAWWHKYSARIVLIVLVALVAWFLAATLTPYKENEKTAFSATTSTHTESYVRAEVQKVEGETGTVTILDGPQKNQPVDVRFYGDTPRTGSTVLVPEQTQVDGPSDVTQVWRIPALMALVAAMVVLVIAIGGRQGALSIGGLVVSIAVIVGYLIPQVLAGHDALVVTSIAAFAIATISVAIAHTLKWRTIISLLSIYAVLAGVILLAVFAAWYTSLTGIYDETSSILGAGSAQSLDMYGILLGGIIIATLGVLDDVVTTQVAAVDELYKLKPRTSWRELFARGMSVGREHLSALINTLALAYVGVALPTILVLTHAVGTSSQALMSVNYEYIAVEVVRTVVSSIGIILAIPLSTALAALLVGKKQQVLGILKRVQPNFRR